MRRKPVMFLSALAVATMGLTACGDDSGGNDEAAVEPTTASEAPATQEEPTTEEPTEQETETGERIPLEEGGGREIPTHTLGDFGSTVEDIDAPDPGPAPEGAVIPARSVTKPPEAIGPFELIGDDSGPARMYSDEVSSVMISVDTNVLSSPYEQLVEYIETDNTPAGTGSCGTNESGSSITCYQRAEGGVITMTAYPEEISLEDMVIFVNHYADQAGAA